MSAEMTETTRRFILDSFPNMDTLRLFLLLGAEPERVFAPGTLAANLRLTTDKVETGLAQLSAVGLVEALGEPQSDFRYCPASPGLMALAAEVIRLDRETPVTLLRLVASRPAEPVKAFADAFKLR